MCGLVAISFVGLLALGCTLNSGDDPDSGASGQGGAHNPQGRDASAGSTSSAEGGAAGAAENDCSVTEEDDICLACVKNKCCDPWWTCVGDCADQLECYQECLQNRGNLTAEDDAACREECSVADGKTQTALIQCLLPKTSDDEEAGCREECF